MLRLLLSLWLALAFVREWCQHTVIVLQQSAAVVELGDREQDGLTQ